MKFLVLVLTFLAVFNICSARSGKVIGGINAQDGYYPFVVSLRHIENGFFCGGSIINVRWVLTAAHCVYRFRPDEIYVGAGENNLINTFDRYDVETVNIHEEFNFNHFGKDIAVVKVTRDFDFNNPRIMPIVLLPDFIGGNINVIAVGWGIYDINRYNYSENLQELKMRTLEHEECKKQIEVSYDELCVFNSKNTGLCEGDSGSPLILEGTNIQVGIDSWVKKCAVGYPDIYTRISSYMNWIYFHIWN